MEFPFIIRCQSCGFKVMTTGRSADIQAQGLTEIKKSCSKCGGRSFKCKKCGKPAKMFRLRKI